MLRTSLLLFAILFIAGCGGKSGNEDAVTQMLAQRAAEVEDARSGERFWQNTATILGGLAIVALIIGAALGSKAKNDADEE